GRQGRQASGEEGRGRGGRAHAGQGAGEAGPQEGGGRTRTAAAHPARARQGAGQAHTQEGGAGRRHCGAAARTGAGQEWHPGYQGQEGGRGRGGELTMRIATWNVNSLKVRMPRVEAWLAEVQPDIACLQETKVSDKAFPAMAFSTLGYESAHFGQGQWNGVA